VEGGGKVSSKSKFASWQQDAGSIRRDGWLLIKKKAGNTAAETEIIRVLRVCVGACA
jgi:hypothetical protein